MIDMLIASAFAGIADPGQPDMTLTTYVGDDTGLVSWEGSLTADYYAPNENGQELFIYTFENYESSEISIFNFLIEDQVAWEVEVAPGEVASFSLATGEPFGFQVTEAVLYNPFEGSFDFFSTIAPLGFAQPIPAPGAIAALGVAAMGRRRRRG